jgi:hypothetical protein
MALWILNGQSKWPSQKVQIKITQLKWPSQNGRVEIDLSKLTVSQVGHLSLLSHFELIFLVKKVVNVNLLQGKALISSLERSEIVTSVVWFPLLQRNNWWVRVRQMDPWSMIFF